LKAEKKKRKRSFWILFHGDRLGGVSGEFEGQLSRKKSRVSNGPLGLVIELESRLAAFVLRGNLIC